MNTCITTRRSTHLIHRDVVDASHEEVFTAAVNASEVHYLVIYEDPRNEDLGRLGQDRDISDEALLATLDHRGEDAGRTRDEIGPLCEFAGSAQELREWMSVLDDGRRGRVFLIYDVKGEARRSTPETRKQSLLLALKWFSSSMFLCLIPVAPLWWPESQPDITWYWIAGLLLSAPVTIWGWIAIHNLEKSVEWDRFDEIKSILVNHPLHWCEAWRDRVGYTPFSEGWRHPIRWFINEPVRQVIHGVLHWIMLLAEGILFILSGLPNLPLILGCFYPFIGIGWLFTLLYSLLFD